jgi:hypothetical protein
MGFFDLFKTSNPDKRDVIIIHYQPFAFSHNVRCLNGSAHAQSSTDIKDVNCSLCLDPKTYKRHWAMKQEEHRTKHQHSPITGEKFEKYRQ